MVPVSWLPAKSKLLQHPHDHCRQSHRRTTASLHTASATNSRQGCQRAKRLGNCARELVVEQTQVPAVTTFHSHSVAILVQHRQLRQQQPPSAHSKPVSELSDAGTEPVRRLPSNQNSLQPRSQTVTASQNTSSMHSHHRHSRQASQRGERLWDGASQLVAEQLRSPARPQRATASNTTMVYS
jgi:hypothetical protein